MFFYRVMPDVSNEQVTFSHLLYDPAPNPNKFTSRPKSQQVNTPEVELVISGHLLNKTKSCPQPFSIIENK